MEKYLINGGKRLFGEVEVQSAKNSVLALLAAAFMCEGEVVLEKCPKITDVFAMLAILEGIGTSHRFEEGNLILQSNAAAGYEIPKQLAKEIRSSIFLLGPVLGRLRRAVVAYPGGCDIGTRPIDLHLSGLRSLGVKISEEGGYIVCDGSDMRGGEVHLSYPSVGATENVMMAAVLTKGVTKIYNAAAEPEIEDLQNFINAAGGKISGAGTQVIIIEGVKKLGGTQFLPIPDRIAAGTYFLAGLMTGGELVIKTNPAHIDSLTGKFAHNACNIQCFSDKISLKADKRPYSVKLIETTPYPGFPTDLQAPVMALCTIAKGTSVIVENLFETRFRHVAELVKMGANITVEGRRATIRGVHSLTGREVNSYDLRGGAAMVLAALAAEGSTTVSGVHHIDRGYEDMEGVLKGLGADIVRKKI